LGNVQRQPSNERRHRRVSSQVDDLRRSNEWAKTLLECPLHRALYALGISAQSRSIRIMTTQVAPGADDEIRVIGASRTPLSDFYHALLRLRWPATIGAISGAFLAINALFALAYLLTGGIAHARPGSFADAFYFSVQTMGTIGYGAMFPESAAANTLVVAEAIASLTMTALATGLVFAKFSRPTARIVFSKRAVISPMNGAPTLMLRVGNERGNRIVDVAIRASISRTERTAEGMRWSAQRP
jgi:inward rectifier potassium channel